MSGMAVDLETGPVAKIEAGVQDEGGIRIGLVTASAQGGVQGEGGIGCVEELDTVSELTARHRFTRRKFTNGTSSYWKARM
jgi:hypothetical protein